MLRGKRIMALLSTTVLLGSFNSTLTPFSSAVQITEKQVDNIKMVQMQDIRLKTFLEHYEKTKVENEKKKAEEIKKQKELEEQKNNEPQWQDFILTFYSSSINENSSAGAVTCQGKKLQPYMVANNIYSLGTQIYLDGYGTKIVSDRGSNKHFSNSTRLDVFIEKEPNESYNQYIKRVNSYWVKKVRGYIVK